MLCGSDLQRSHEGWGSRAGAPRQRTGRTRTERAGAGAEAPTACREENVNSACINGTRPSISRPPCCRRPHGAAAAAPRLSRLPSVTACSCAASCRSSPGCSQQMIRHDAHTCARCSTLPRPGTLASHGRCCRQRCRLRVLPRDPADLPLQFYTGGSASHHAPAAPLRLASRRPTCSSTGCTGAAPRPARAAAAAAPPCMAGHGGREPNCASHNACSTDAMPLRPRQARA